MNYLIPLMFLFLIACKKNEDVKPAITHAPQYGHVRIEVSPNPKQSIPYEWKIKAYASDKTKTDIIWDKVITAPANSDGRVSNEFYIQDNQKVTVNASLTNPSLCSTPIRVKIFYNEGKIILKDTTITNACATNGMITASVNLPNYVK